MFKCLSAREPPHWPGNARSFLKQCRGGGMVDARCHSKDNSTERVWGQCAWFNSIAGYGGSPRVRSNRTPGSNYGEVTERLTYRTVNPKSHECGGSNPPLSTNFKPNWRMRATWHGEREPKRVTARRDGLMAQAAGALATPLHRIDRPPVGPPRGE